MTQKKGLGALEFARVPLRRPDFENNTSQFVRVPLRRPDFEDESEKSKATSKPKKKTEELNYPGTDIPYKYRGLADVEFRADIDPIISGVPPALLKYQDIEQKTGGDVGELIKVILGEDDPNNPKPSEGFDGLTFTDAAVLLGRYNPTEDERYYRKPVLGERGVSYAFEPNTSEFDSDRLIETIVEELGHGGMRILENTDPEENFLGKLQRIMFGKKPESDKAVSGYNPIRASEYGLPEDDQSELALEEELMNQYQYKARENDPNVSMDTIGQRSNIVANRKSARYFAEMLDRIDKAALEELRRRGRVSIPFTSTEIPKEKLLEKFLRRLRGGAEPKLPLTRYAQGGIATLGKV
tara:strand:+ start:769 stop:1830 length:1062 start_codon:yes stop_codon:yes gene_type:complete